MRKQLLLYVGIFCCVFVQIELVYCERLLIPCFWMCFRSGSTHHMSSIYRCLNISLSFSLNPGRYITVVQKYTKVVFQWSHYLGICCTTDIGDGRQTPLTYYGAIVFRWDVCLLDGKNYVIGDFDTDVNRA